MATLKRKQQKLLGFGARWQDSDPIAARSREREVCQALQSLREVYCEQRQLQDATGRAECLAVLDAKTHRASLERRHGKVIESFGRLELGKWVLEPEEVLYLAERATLDVYIADGLEGQCDGLKTEDLSKESREHVTQCPSHAVGKGEDGAPGLRRLLVPELFRLVLGVNIKFQDYLVFAHLRRAGFSLYRLGPRPETTLASTPSNTCASNESKADLASWLTVRAMPQPSPMPCLPAQTLCMASTSNNSSIGGVAPGTADPSCWMLHRASTGRHGSDISSHTAAGQSQPVVLTVDPSESVHAAMERLIGDQGAGARSDSVAPLFAMHPPPIFAVADAASGNSPVFLQMLPPERPQGQQEEITCDGVSPRSPSVESLGKVTGDVGDSSASEKEIPTAYRVEPTEAAAAASTEAALTAARPSTTTPSTKVACTKSSDYAALRANVVRLVSSTLADNHRLSCDNETCLGDDRKRQKVPPVDESWFL